MWPRVCARTGLCCDPAMLSAVYLFERMQVDVRVYCTLCVFLIQPSDKMQRAASGQAVERCEGKGEEKMQPSVFESPTVFCSVLDGIKRHGCPWFHS